MDAWTTIAGVAALLTGALLCGVLFERLGQSALVGYLVSGLILGPGCLAVVDDATVVRGMAELGVAFLLFSIGLEFSWKHIRSMGRVAFGGGAVQLLLTAAVVAGIGRALGLPWAAAVAVGLIVAPSSTACVFRLLEQRTELDSHHGRASAGVLLFQDLALVPLLLAIRMLGSRGGEGAAGEILRSFLSLAMFAAGAYVVFRFVLPMLLNAAVVTRNRELPLILAVATCLGAAWTSHALGLSPVLGAFAAGILLAESPFATWVRADVQGLRTICLTLFFSSLAMIDGLDWVFKHWYWIVAAVPTVLFGKWLLTTVAVRLVGLPMRAAMAAGLCIAQTGEFSFVLAEVAQGTGLIGEEVFKLIVITTLLTLLATPYLVSWARRVSAGGDVAGGHGHGGHGHSLDLTDHAVIIGFGPSGRAVFDAIATETAVAIVDFHPRVDYSPDYVGAFPVVGDATQTDVLEQACVSKAAIVIITIPDQAMSLRASQLIRELSPKVPIIVRSRYARFVDELAEWADVVVDEEKSMGERLADHARKRWAAGQSAS